MAIEVLLTLKLSFNNNERLFEIDAVNKRSRAPSNTFMFIHKFLGKNFTDERVRQRTNAFWEGYNLLENEVTQSCHLLQA